MVKKNIIQETKNPSTIILTSIIILLLIIYMSIVNKNNVPYLFNHTIIKMLLFGLIAYTFYYDKLIGLFLAMTVILSISFVTNKTNMCKNNDFLKPFVNEEEQQSEIPHTEMQHSEMQHSEMPQSEIQHSEMSNQYFPLGVPSSGLKIDTFSSL